ncbi:AAA family ATPase [Rhizobium sp. 1399]|uniref:AAA family ATPase n=1 Tax=Rhizobium sp. 1399 TaxID=2817758 RepID=UPI00285915FC|nr:AAA family ATPase [Rhizobium sp. 1399]MDR6671393.1 putative ATPase [Rhizobium sp. 1399]
MDTLRVGSIGLRDVGPFTQLDVQFPIKAGLSLVCGDNGIGKTSLLEAIVAVFSRGQLLRLKRRQGADAGRIMLEYETKDHVSTTEVKVQQFEPDQFDYLNTQLGDIASNVINVRAARDFIYQRQDGITRDPSLNPRHHGDRVANGLASSEIKSWFSNRYLLRPHAETSSWTSEMMENLDAAISYFSLLDPNVKLDRVDVRTFDIIVATPSGLVPFEYLSSGFKSAYILLLGIIKEIEFRGIGVAARDFAGLILIDELDLHLHPVWQREIGAAMKRAFPNAQIIATTHSPHVIQAAQASEVIALVRDADGNVKSRPVPSTKFGYAGWSLEEVLEDIMGVEDTKTPIFRAAMQNFDAAIDQDNADAVVASLDILREMLHPNNSTRKLIEIQAAPYIGAVSSTEGEQ